jgi:CRP/FNR family transcriptional regulator
MQNISVNPVEKIAALRNNSYFRELSQDALEELAQGACLWRFERGEAICWQGEPCTSLYIIQRGSVKLFKLSPRGRELIIKVLEEGATFNEVPVFDHGLNPVNAAALEESDIWLVEAAIIRQMLATLPEMTRTMILNLTQNLRMLVDMVEELSFYQVINRLARLITHLPPEQLSGPRAQRLTQDQLAARLGTVREVATRALHDLERSGAIQVTRRGIQILNEAVLRDWAQKM